LRSTLLRKTDFDDVPIRPQRVFQEMNDFFDRNAIMVTAIGLYQIMSGQFQKTYKPRHYICCGQAGPLGWEVPACTGAKLGRPDNLVVGVVGDYSFEFLMEEVAVAVQYRVPYVLVDAQQRLHGPHPPGREVRLRRPQLRGEPGLRGPAGPLRHGPRRASCRRWAAWAGAVTTPDEIQPALQWAGRGQRPAARPRPGGDHVASARSTPRWASPSTRSTSTSRCSTAPREHAGAVVGDVPDAIEAHTRSGALRRPRAARSPARA